jgi:predicted nucleic acid-binding protein
MGTGQGLFWKICKWPNQSVGGPEASFEKENKELTIKYSDLPMDFADACLVLLAEKIDMNQIATIDRDFTIYRIKGRKRFNVVLS